MSGGAAELALPLLAALPNPRPQQSDLFVRVIVGSFRMAVSRLAMLVCSGGVLFCILVLTYGVMMRCLMVVMRGGVMMGGRLMVMLTRRMLWCLCHFIAPSLGVTASGIAS